MSLYFSFSIGCLWLLFSAANVLGQTTAPKYSNEFMKIGVGARAAGMGNAQTAVVNDVTAGYWNPAGLLQMDTRHEVGLMHSEYFAGIAKYDYAAFATQIDPDRRLAVSAIRLGIDDIPNTLNLQDGNSFNYDNITDFSVADLGIMVSYAQRMKFLDGLSFGGNLKIINRTVGPFATAWGFGLDFGAQYRKGGLMLGASAMDVTNTFNAWTFNTELLEDAFVATGNEIPQNSVEITLPSVNLGVAYLFFRERAVNLIPALDINTHFDGPRNVLANAGPVSFDTRFGLEASYKQIVFLRGGLMNVQYVEDIGGEEQLDVFPTAGIGVQYKFFALDYALTNVGDFQGNLYSHLISLRLFFDRVAL